MLKQKMRNILLSRDEGQCAAVVRGVGKFTKLPTLPCTMRGAGDALHYWHGNFVSICVHELSELEKIYIHVRLPHQRDRDGMQLHNLNAWIKKPNKISLHEFHAIC